MKKNLVSLQKRLRINICKLWYGISGESVIKLYCEMSSRIELGCKMKGRSTCAMY